MKSWLMVTAIMMFLSVGATGLFDQTLWGYGKSKEDITALCVHYKASYGWSKGYAVEAYVLEGSDLNKALSTNKFNIWKTYAVIIWDVGQYSVAELTQSYMLLAGYTVEAEDQLGRLWKLSTNAAFCR